jgi:hypothetical protein
MASNATAARAYGPVYELRLEVPEHESQWQLEIWQLPSTATPRLSAPEHVGTLKGAALRIVENRVLKRLARTRIQLGVIKSGKRRNWPLDEDMALSFGLLFRVLAPMRNLDRIREVADGIDTMSREEAGYWLGMAIHRTHPRRVLAALRLLLTRPLKHQ